MFDRRLLLNFDWLLFSLTLLLTLVGLVNLYSASQAGNYSGGSPFQRQLYWLAAGLVVLVLALRADTSFLRRIAYPSYFVCLLLLVAVPILGRAISGSQRWLSLFGFTIQPSEPAKLALVLALAVYFSQRVKKLNFTGLALPSLILLPPVALVLKQPDLGTALVFVLLFFSLLFLTDLPLKRWLAMIAAGLLAAPFSWFFLYDYQKARVTAFLQPLADPSGAGYQSIQSKIAIGSGKLLGKGFLAGTQTKLRFLPEQQTDFIFSVLAEEWGFVGSLVLLGLFVLWIGRALMIAAQFRQTFPSLVTYGIACLVTWQTFLNIAMASGLAPVVGVPLPFLSYGGSALVTFMLGTGIILSMRMRRFAN
jgi:rod shape determining protein RodA